MENDTDLLLIHGDVLHEDFFKLKTGLAGMIMQKFVNYHIRAAILLSEDYKITGRFKELIVESKKGNDFNVFYDITEAETWLVK